MLLRRLAVILLCFPGCCFASAVGEVSFFVSTFCPTNWQPLDGGYVYYSTSGFWNVPERTSPIVIRMLSGYGACVDDSGACQLPDGRGAFLRSLHVDSNGTTWDMNRVWLSTQSDTLQGHGHNLDWNHTNNATGALSPGGANSVASTGGSGFANSLVTLSPFGSPRVATETRPINVAFQACVRLIEDNVSNNYYSSGGSMVSTFTLVDVSTTAVDLLTPGIWKYFTGGDMSFIFGLFVGFAVIAGYKAGGGGS